MTLFLFSELYLEELSIVIVMKDTDCQADALLERPPTPLFIPAMSVHHAHTQTEDGEV